LLCACLSPTSYHAAKDRYDEGYFEEQLPDGRYKIQYRGNAVTTKDTVERSLIYRAAELTLEEGYDYFVVLQNYTQADTTYAPSVKRKGESDIPLPDHSYYTNRFSWGTEDDDLEMGTTCYCATMYITMHHGDVPDDKDGAFDAKIAKRNLSQDINPN
jgi:hypothetical protein